MMAKVPPGWGHDSFSKFVEDARQNTFATYNNPEVSGVSKQLRDINDTLELAAGNMKNPGVENLVSAFFLARTHASYLGALRLSFSGQIPEAYMVMRGCLENPLYALYLHKNPDSVHTWFKRHDDEESMKRVKKEFRIRTMLDLLKESNARTGQAAETLYERAIDYGAHPNPRAITANLSIKENEKEHAFTYNYNCLTGLCDALRRCLGANAQVGVCCLDIFYLIFKTRFDILVIPERLRRLRDGL